MQVLDWLYRVYAAEIDLFQQAQTVWDQTMVLSSYGPVLLIIALVVGKAVKINLNPFYPLLLFLEYSIWPIWFHYVDSEMAGYFAYLTVYLTVSYILSFRLGWMSSLFRLFYLLSSVIVLANLLAYLTDGVAALEWFYDAYFDLMTAIMLVMVGMAGVAMYGTGSGSGGKRLYSYTPESIVRTLFQRFRGQII